MNAALRTEVKIGFMPLLDCALLVVAHEVGMARQQGLALRLLRESSWANIRDRVAVGHFDAAQMLAPMVMAENLGLGHFKTPLVAPVALGTGGNAITVSRELWQAMAADGAKLGADPVSLARALAGLVQRRAADGEAQLTLAMVFPFSCHNYQLRDWLESGGIDPDRDVRLVVLPPPLLVDALRSGQVDGFCVGEPWNSLAVDADIGMIAAACSDVWPNPPEKVLGMRARFADENPDVVARLIRAIHGAALWAADAGNHEDLAQLLAQPRYVGAPARLLLPVLGGAIRYESGQPALVRPEFLTLGPAAIEPRVQYADLIHARMQRWGQITGSAAGLADARAAFQAERFRSVLRDTGGRNA